MQNKITFWTHHIILDGVGHWGLNLALQVVVDGHHPQNTLLHEHPPAKGLHHTPVAWPLVWGTLGVEREWVSQSKTGWNLEEMLPTLLNTLLENRQNIMKMITTYLRSLHRGHDEGIREELQGARHHHPGIVACLECRHQQHVLSCTITTKMHECFTWSANIWPTACWAGYRIVYHGNWGDLNSIRSSI